MEQPPPLRSDPEFRPVHSDRSLPTVIDPAVYRRVLVNPFLGFLASAVWLGLLRLTLILEDTDSPGRVPMLGLLIVSAWFLPRLFRFQCLDCGRTGRMSRWKSHVCPTVALRIVQGRPLRFRGPGPLVQMMIWGGVLAFVLMMARASGLTLR